MLEEKISAKGAPNMHKNKILYIAGWGRSGTTLLDNILGQFPGFFAGGELRYIWERSFGENRLCGCSEPFDSCAVWQSISTSMFENREKVNAKLLHAQTHKYSRTMRIPWLFTKRDNQTKDFIDYLQVLESLYAAIFSSTDSHVVIDSSKYPVYLALLGLLPSFDIFTLHMIRDPRAVAYSWLKPKKNLDSKKVEQMGKIGVVRSSLLWISWNIATEYISHQRKSATYRLRYEDFVSQPLNSIEDILQMLGESDYDLPFINKQTVFLKPNHTTSGNPDRFSTGSVRIKEDFRWKTELPFFQKLVVTLMTFPLLLRYGYKLW